MQLILQWFNFNTFGHKHKWAEKLKLKFIKPWKQHYMSSKKMFPYHLQAKDLATGRCFKTNYFNTYINTISDSMGKSYPVPKASEKPGIKTWDLTWNWEVSESAAFPKEATI